MNNNFIKSLVQDQSKVGKYLAAAEEELKNAKLSDMSDSLKRIKGIFNEISSYNREIDNSIDALYRKRDQLFSNLITGMLANFYCEKIKEKIDSFYEKSSATSILTGESNELDKILEDISASLLAFSSTISANNSNIDNTSNLNSIFNKTNSGSGDGSSSDDNDNNNSNLDINENNISQNLSGNEDETTSDSLIDVANTKSPGSLSMTDSVAQKFIEQLDKLEEIFDSIKGPLGFSDLNVTEDGIKGFDHIYNLVDSDKLTGTVKFSKGAVGNVKNLEGGENVFSSDVDDNGNCYFSKNTDALVAECSFKVKKTFILEDGTEKNPYIIKSINDAIDKGLFTEGVDLVKHYSLEADLILNSSPTEDGILYLNKSIMPNNHKITCGKSIEKVFFGGRIMNKDSDIKSELAVCLKSSLELSISIPLLIPSLVFTDVNIELGNSAVVYEDCKLNFYVELSGSPILAITPIYNVTVYGTGLKSNITGEGGTKNISFYYVSSISPLNKNIKWTLEEDPGVVSSKLSKKDVKNIDGIPIESINLQKITATGNTIVEKDTEVTMSGTVTKDVETGLYTINGDSPITFKNIFNTYTSFTADLSEIELTITKEDEDGNTSDGESFKAFASEKNVTCQLITSNNINDIELDPVVKTLVNLGELSKLKSDLPLLQGKLPANISNLLSELDKKELDIIKSLEYRNSLPTEEENKNYPIGSNISIKNNDGSYTIYTSYPDNNSSGMKWEKNEKLNNNPNLTIILNSLNKTSNSKYTNKLDMITDYLRIINGINESKNSLSNILKNQEKTNAKGIYDAVQSFQYINTTRMSDDPNFNEDYMSNIKNSFDTIGGNVSQMLLSTDSVSINIFNIFNIISSNVADLKILIDNFLLDVVPSIIKLNDVIDNKCSFIKNYFEYDDLFLKSINILNSAVYSLNSGTYSELTFNPVKCSGIRDYSEEWSKKMHTILSDGAHGILQLYLGYEYGYNLLPEKYIEKNTLSAVIYKLLINDSLLRLYKKGSINKNYLKDIIMFDREAELKNKYNITVRSDANYEKISNRLTELIPELLTFTNLDLFPVLISFGSETNSEKQYITNLVDIGIIKYLFKNYKDITEISERIENLKNILDEVNYNFKIMFIKSRFSNILNKIKLHIKDTNKKTIFESSKANFEKILLKCIDETDSNILKKYQAVWTFKYYTEFSNIELITPFIFDPNKSDVCNYLKNSSFTDIYEENISSYTKSALNEMIPEIWNKMAKLII